MKYVNVILSSMILGFGFSTIIVVMLTLHKKKLTRKIGWAFVNTAVAIIRWVGIVAIAIWIVGTIWDLFHDGLTSRATDEYAWAYWIMVFGPLLTQLLWIRKVRTSFLGLIFVASGLIWTSGVFLEDFTIALSNFHRDYVQDGNFVLMTVLEYCIRIAAFIALVWLIQSVNARRNIKNKNKLKSNL